MTDVHKSGCSQPTSQTGLMLPIKAREAPDFVSQAVGAVSTPGRESIKPSRQIDRVECLRPQIHPLSRPSRMRMDSEFSSP